jgi:hypothetical protein
MNPTTRLWLRVLAIVAAVALALYFAAPFLVRLVGGTIAVSLFLVNVLLPTASVFVLAWFAYSVFLRKYWRAWRINRIREGRYLREVMQRSRKQ